MFSPKSSCCCIPFRFPILFIFLVCFLISSLSLCEINAQQQQNSTTASITTTSASTIPTTTILPPITTSPGQQPDKLDSMEVVMKWRPKVTADTSSNILEVTKQVLKSRETLRYSFQTDVAEFLNIPSIYVAVGNFVGDANDGSFSVKLTFTTIYNATAYLYNLKYYVSSTDVVPRLAFPRICDAVLNTRVAVAAVVTSVEGVRLTEAKLVEVDNSNPICFLGQDKCAGSYVIVLVIAAVAVLGVYFGMKKLFTFWKQTAPTRDQTFNQEGRSMQEMNGLNDLLEDRTVGFDNSAAATTTTNADVSLMQQYHHEEQQRKMASRTQQQQQQQHDADVAEML
jgi:hypothetical protein